MMHEPNEENDTCVKFSTRSWHKRLYDKVYGVYGKYSLYETDYKITEEDGERKIKPFLKPKEINLCPYMRRVVWACILFPFLMIWRHLPQNWQYYEDEAKAISIYAILCALAHVLINLEYDVWYAWLLGFFGGLALAFAGWGIVLFAERLREKMYERGTRVLPNTSLLRTYFKSKHEKICPCIEFVDEEKKEDD